MSDEHGNHFLWSLQNIPFFAVFATKEVAAQIENRPMLTRLIEGLLIAAITGAFSAYLALHTMAAITSTQMQDLKEEVQQQHQDTINQLNNLQQEVNMLRANDYYVTPGHGPNGS